MTPVPLLTFYCLLILLASWSGGWLPSVVRLTHTRMQVATSVVAGLMLGVGLLHMLPHAWYELESIDRTARWLMGGFLVMFLIQRFFHFHHHDVPDEAVEEAACCDHAGHNPEAAHAHSHHHDTLAAKSARHLSWGGAAFGLSLHTIIDGIALAASVQAELHGDEHAVLLGLGTFLVIILHKPFDAMAITTLMAAGGWSKRARHLVNAGFALMIPLGVLLFHFAAGQFTGPGHIFLGAALAFSGGTFLCIAASDLLPELQFHAHDRVKLTAALLAGLLFSVVIGRFETSGHERHQSPAAAESPAHDHEPAPSR